MAHLKLPEMPAGPLLELHGQRKILNCPEGLKLLLEDCTREVLRHQPDNIYVFLSEMMKIKMIGRDHPHRKSWEYRRWSWDGSSLLSQEELEEFLAEFGISVEQARSLALIIQSAYRGYLDRKRVKGIKVERDEHRKILWDEWRHPGNLYVSLRDVLDILAFYKISLFEANAYATKIQKVFRGYNTRLHIEVEHPELAAHLNQLGITKKEVDENAIKIQKTMRGFQTRKALKELQEQGIKPTEEAINEHINKKRMNARQKEEVEEEEKDESLGKDYDYEGEDMEASEGEGEDEGDESSRKYEAFFPTGLNPQDVKDIKKGEKIPPKFTHEHFGEINPEVIREKFSSPDFKKQMGKMMKDLDEVKEEKRKEIEKLNTKGSSTQDGAVVQKEVAKEVRKIAGIEEEEGRRGSTKLNIEKEEGGGERRLSSTSNADKEVVGAEDEERKLSTNSNAAEERRLSTKSNPEEGLGIEERRLSTKLNGAEKRKSSLKSNAADERKASIKSNGEK